MSFLRCEMRDLFVYNKLHSSFMNCLTSSWYNWENWQEMNLNWILSCFQNLENNKDSISNGKDYKGLEYNWYRTSHRRCSIKKGVLKNFTKFTGKHLCQSLFFNKVAGLRQAVAGLRTPPGDCFCNWSKYKWNIWKCVRFALVLSKYWWLTVCWSSFLTSPHLASILEN